MGQTIEILDTTVIDRVLVIDTDRSLAGQEGEAFTAKPELDGGPTTFPTRLAARLFEQLDGVDHVFVMSNAVSIRRPGGWSDDQIASASRIVAEFFRFYL